MDCSSTLAHTITAGRVASSHAGTGEDTLSRRLRRATTGRPDKPLVLAGFVRHVASLVRDVRDVRDVPAGHVVASPQPDRSVTTDAAADPLTTNARRGRPRHARHGSRSPSPRVARHAATGCQTDWDSAGTSCGYQLPQPRRPRLSPRRWWRGPPRPGPDRVEDILRGQQLVPRPTRDRPAAIITRSTS